jgi:hypothetical protein
MALRTERVAAEPEAGGPVDSEASRYRKATTVHLVPTVREALEDRAWAERKTVSRLAETLLGEALGLPEGHATSPTRLGPAIGRKA